MCCPCSRIYSGNCFCLSFHFLLFTFKCSFFCVRVFACLCECATWMCGWSPKKKGEGIRSPRAEGTDDMSCHVPWETNLHPLQEHKLWPAEPSLQPFHNLLKKKNLVLCMLLNLAKFCQLKYYFIPVTIHKTIEEFIVSHSPAHPVSIWW